MGWTGTEPETVGSSALARTKSRLDRRGIEFAVENGVKQGDPLSPELFNCVLEEVFHNLRWESKGLSFGCKKLNYLRFANDIVLIASNEAESMLENLKREGSEMTSYEGKRFYKTYRKEACELKWKWAGHVGKTEEEKWTRTVTCWQPKGKQRRGGGPRTRWVDDIKRVAGMNGASGGHESSRR
ncbi:hypothetical protein AAG570_009199 [Ranatra chinensis]|uniref:Reverse transcriptase domain-containing protein n=1 Tax=Ranatra chinensis TaxID=642074 RepID=A0ABD0ZGD5_9HEMI